MKEIIDELISKGINSSTINRIQYSLELDQTLSLLESRNHDYDDPEKLIIDMLISACEFYDGDWAGIMEADLTMKVWSTLWWYNRKTGGMTPNSFGDLQEGDYLERWIYALTHGEPLIIEDIEHVKEQAPLEYAFLKENNVQTIVAVPFWKRPTGFLIVRNPKRYITDTSILRMMAFVAVSSVNERRLQDSLKLNALPGQIQSDKDVIINLFGEVQIITRRGMITEKNLNSTLLSSFVAYAVLHRSRPASAIEIFNDLRPDENNACLDKSTIAKRAKNMIYRLNTQFDLISDHKLVELTTSGYRLNPELHIQSDILLFEEYWNQAQITASLTEKISILEKAVSIYKNGLYADYYDVPWFVSSRAHFAIRFSGVINLLLSTFDRQNDYRNIHKYANAALSILPGSQDVYYWLIYSIVRLGSKEIALAELAAAKKALTQEDFSDLCQRLDNSGIHL